MLVLSRLEGERIYIGDDIVVQIVEIRKNGNVRVGIEAPREIPIIRDDAVRTGRKAK